MAVISLHRPPAGEPDAVRVVADGFRWSTFLFAPVALLAARLWAGFAAWLAVVVVLILLVGMGWLAPGAALLAVAILHLGVALDLASGERRQLQRRGWTMVALSDASMPTPVEPPAPAAPIGPTDGTPSGTAPVAGPARPDVLGLFPDRR